MVSFDDGVSEICNSLTEEKEDASFPPIAFWNDATQSLSRKKKKKKSREQQQEEQEQEKKRAPSRSPRPFRTVFPVQTSSSSSSSSSSSKERERVMRFGASEKSDVTTMESVDFFVSNSKDKQKERKGPNTKREREKKTTF